MSRSSRVIHGWILLLAFSLSGEALAQDVVPLSADTTVQITFGPVLSDDGVAVDNQLGVIGLENLCLLFENIALLGGRVYFAVRGAGRFDLDREEHFVDYS